MGIHAIPEKDRVGNPSHPEERPPASHRGPAASHPLRQNTTSYPWGYHPAQRSPPTPPATQPSGTRRSQALPLPSLQLPLRWVPPGSGGAMGAPAVLWTAGLLPCSLQGSLALGAV